MMAMMRSPRIRFFPATILPSLPVSLNISLLHAILLNTAALTVLIFHLRLVLIRILLLLEICTIHRGIISMLHIASYLRWLPAPSHCTGRCRSRRCKISRNMRSTQWRERTGGHVLRRQIRRLSGIGFASGILIPIVFRVQVEASLGQARISETTFDLAVFGNESLAFQRRRMALPTSRSREGAKTGQIGHAWIPALMTVVCRRRSAFVTILSVGMSVDAIRTVAPGAILTDDHLAAALLRWGLQGHALALVDVVLPSRHLVGTYARSYPTKDD